VLSYFGAVHSVSLERTTERNKQLITDTLRLLHMQIKQLQSARW